MIEAKFYHIDIFRNVRTELNSSEFFTDTVMVCGRLEITSPKDNVIEMRVNNSIYGIEFKEEPIRKCLACGKVACSHLCAECSKDRGL